MATEVRLPKLGVEGDAATFNQWLVAEGDEVVNEQVVATIETEKVVAEIHAEADGFLHQVATEETEYVVGDLLATIAATREEYEQLLAGGDGSAPAASAELEVPTETPIPGPKPDGPARTSEPTAVGDVHLRRNELARQRGPLASPLARRVAAQHGIEIDGIAGSGPQGAVRRRDVEAAVAAGTAPTTEVAPGVATGVPDKEAGRSIPLSALRRTIAARMYQSLQDSAQMTDIREVDVTRLVDFRGMLAAQAEQVGYKLSFTDLLVRATAMVLRKVPELNASFVDDHVRLHENVNIGVAVAIPDGLLVPVIANPDQLTIRALHEGLSDLIERTRERKATSADFSGGTFTLTNIGSYGSQFGTPVLNPPEVGILATGKMEQRPVVRDGAVVPGRTMFLSLTVDHRVVDGEVSGRFLNELTELLGTPESILLG